MFRKFAFLLSAMALAAVAFSCGDRIEPENDKPLSDMIVGEWRLISDSDRLSENASMDIYLSFSQDNTFELYQKLGNVLYFRRYSGTYAIDEDNVVSGEYSGGDAWASDYEVSFDRKGDLVMTALRGEPVCRYGKSEIPSAVREGAVDVRSSDVFPFL